MSYTYLLPHIVQDDTAKTALASVVLTNASSLGNLLCDITINGSIYYTKHKFVSSSSKHQPVRSLIHSAQCGEDDEREIYCLLIVAIAALEETLIVGIQQNDELM